MVECGRVDHPPPEDMGESLVNYDKLLDQYSECRARHKALVEFERKRK